MIMTMALEPLEPVPQLITFQNESYEVSIDYYHSLPSYDLKLIHRLY